MIFLRFVFSGPFSISSCVAVLLMFLSGVGLQILSCNGGFVSVTLVSGAVTACALGLQVWSRDFDVLFTYMGCGFVAVLLMVLSGFGVAITFVPW